MELKTVKQGCKNGKQCFCDGSCNRKASYLENLISQVPENAYDIKLPVNGVIESPKEELKTEIGKQAVYNKIRLLVNTVPNDMLLGEAVRKLFS
jgi:hypothetical protein